MKTLTILLSLLTSIALVGCAVAPGYVGPNDVSASPFLMSSRLQYRGFSIARPTHSAWFIRVSEQTHTHAIVRCRLASPTHSAFVSVDLNSLPRAATSPTDFAELSRRDHIGDTNRLTIVSYEQHLSTVQGQWAIEYEMTVRDSGARNSPDKPLTMRVSGFVISHPTFPNGIVVITYSERGVPEELGSEVEADGKEIIKGIRLESEPGKPVA